MSNFWATSMGRRCIWNFKFIGFESGLSDVLIGKAKPVYQELKVAFKSFEKKA